MRDFVGVEVTRLILKSQRLLTSSSLNSIVESAQCAVYVAAGILACRGAGLPSPAD
jgi:hypothetical protein